MTRAQDGAGHVGYGLLFGGTALLAIGVEAGWAARLAGEAIWLVIGVRMGSTSISLWGAVGTIVDGAGFALRFLPGVVGGS